MPILFRNLTQDVLCHFPGYDGWIGQSYGGLLQKLDNLLIFHSAWITWAAVAAIR